MGNLFCDKCNARLISPEDVVPSESERAEESDAAPVKGISLPTRSVEDDDEEETSLPDWLSGLVDEDAFDEEGAAAEESADSFSLDGDDLPDWLRDIQEPVEAAPETADVSPVREEESEAFSLDDEDLPDWMRDVEGETEAAGESAEALTSEAEALSAEALPDWMQETEAQAEEPQEPDAPSLEDEDLPDWLRSAEEPAETAVGAELETPGPAEPTEGPEEIQEEPAPVDEAEAPAEEWDIPDWLAEQAAPSLMEDQEPTDQALPDWLTERAEETPSTGAPSSQAMPDWLQTGAGAAAPVPEPEAQAEEAETPPPTEEVVEVAPESEEPEAEPSPEFDVEGLPDWLSEEFEEPSPEPDAQPAPTDEAQAVSADLPNWLSDLDEEAGGAEVVEVEPQAEELQEEREPQVAPEPVVEAPSDEEGEAVPDWLSDIEVTDQVDVEAATEVFAEQQEESTEAPEAAIPEEAPEWLRDIAPSSRPPELREETPALIEAEAEAEEAEEPEPEPSPEPEEIPDWLQELEPSAAESAERPAPPSSEGEDEGPRPAPANLPAWMQGLRPAKGAGEAEEMQPFTEAAEVEGLVAAEVPDWIRALRPELEAGGAETPRSERIQKTAAVEMEGPLSNLRGVLTETVVIDLPSDVGVEVSTTVSDDVREQAELWQELLSRPRSVKRSVTQPGRQRGQRAIGVRLLLAAILFLGTLTGLWFLSADLRVSQTPSPQSAPGVGLLRDQLEQLQAGDTVLMVVEYGPAYADEMNAMAEALLEHLQEREVSLRLASTLPEGTGLSHAAVTAVYGSDDVVLGRTYLVNQMPGVAGYLQSPDVQSAAHLVVLASRPSRIRWWVEQNAALAGVNGANPLPISVAASASAGPLISPYLDRTMVDGWIIGLPQTLTYRELRGFDNASYAGIPDVLMLAHWVAAGFLLFGLLYYLALGKKGAG